MSRLLYLPVNEASRRFGERIRITRLGLGLTQRELAEMFRIWPSTVSRLECGRFDITRTHPKWQVLNERMRIWAEMNKGGKKKKFRNSRRKPARQAKAETLFPYVNPTDRFWAAIHQKEKENGREDTQ